MAIATKTTLVPIHQDGILADMGMDMSVQCLSCKNLNKEPITCRAFSDGILGDILSGKFDHSEKHPDQKNDIIFEPIKE